MTATATATASTRTPGAPPHEATWEMAQTIVTFRSLHVVADLRVADHLGDGLVPAEDLAAACGADLEAHGRSTR